MTKKNLFGLSLSELSDYFESIGEKRFRAKQVLPWLYQKWVTNIDSMTNLSKDLRQTLKHSAEINTFKGMTKKKSRDGSVKYLFNCFDDKQVESVFMPMKNGYTMCLSSQVGCAQACSFCMTGTMGFIRNLTSAEILGQVVCMLRDQAHDRPFNLVMMGMGEPLLNMKNLEIALDLLFAKTGFNLSPKRVTISTSGHVKNIERLSRFKPLPRLAVSLNASTNEQRSEIMPINDRWPIEALLQACRSFPLGTRDRITFEYVVIRDFNDSIADAKRLIGMLEGIRSKVNIIPFNETPELPYRQPADEDLHAFHERLNRAGLRNTIRWSKGRDIGAACGQLAVKGIKGKKRRV
ncbi:MAG: 23S rRNA (adenine(2503)-C(2))-methyltransferase RlmN [Acidobacteria bacterium]|nr:MAG: 23S rRNA (adenine(2503)-C(2))-methyltransferase RlmN [Acidobacteriota bacterium]